MLRSEKLLSLLGTVLTLMKFVTGAKLIQGDFVEYGDDHGFFIHLRRVH